MAMDTGFDVSEKQDERRNKGVGTGVHFGLTSGVITTLGLMVGLRAGTGSVAAVVGGILTIAVADALSDALGIHIAKESESGTTEREVWNATGATFVAKFAMALSFVVPVLLLDLDTAVLVSIAWGLAVLGLLSYRMARADGNRPASVIGEHLFIAIVVIVLTHYVGELVRVFTPA